MLLFLDFDGVLRHRETPPYRLEPDRLNAFEDAVRLIPEAEIVITSTWREVMPLAKLRGLFAEDLQARIIGVTPFAWAQDGHYRHRELLAFLKRHRLLERPWIGIGDDRAHYPAGCELLLIDPSRGFDREAGRRLVLAARRLLASKPA